MAMIKRNK